MNAIEVRAANQEARTNPADYERELHESWSDEIQDRASAQTEVLKERLDRLRVSSWYHGGLNE